MIYDFRDFAEQGDFVGQIERRIQENTLAHALLLTGGEGVGKKTLAQVIAAALLCRDPRRRPCGQCASCRLLEADNHPDLIVLQKGNPIAPGEEKGKNIIPVADIEELENRCAAHPFEGDRRVVMIYRAEDLNPPAQNKLLKTLEEPPEGTFFLLTSEKKDSLLPTIVSRCLSVYLHPWRLDTVMRVLGENGVSESKARAAAEESAGSVGIALKLAGDEAYWKLREEVYQSFFQAPLRSRILAVSNRWKDRRGEANTLFSMIEAGIHQLMDFRIHGPESGSGAGRKDLYDPSWICFAQKCDFSAFTDLLDMMTLARRRLQANVNFQVIVEQILFKLMEANSKWSM